MRFFANPSTQRVRDAMTAGLIDCITTPKQGNKLPEGARFCADNGVFGKGYPGDAAWWAWVDGLPRDLCEFVVAPDVVGDAAATLERSRPWLLKIREAGFAAAFAAQDGLEALTIPWDTFDVLFIAGTTEWKLSRVAAELADEARAHGLKVHMGRVNSEDRLRRAIAVGCDTADGTFLAFGPDTNLPRLMAWFTRMPKRQPPHVEFPMFDLPTTEGAA